VAEPTADPGDDTRIAIGNRYEGAITVIVDVRVVQRISGAVHVPELTTVTCFPVLSLKSSGARALRGVTA
jgi:hypothetical protein